MFYPIYHPFRMLSIDRFAIGWILGVNMSNPSKTALLSQDVGKTAISARRRGEAMHF
jgi:hypothetical protein